MESEVWRSIILVLVLDKTIQDMMHDDRNLMAEKEKPRVLQCTMINHNRQECSTFSSKEIWSYHFDGYLIWVYTSTLMWGKLHYKRVFWYLVLQITVFTNLAKFSLHKISKFCLEKVKSSSHFVLVMIRAFE